MFNIEKKTLAKLREEYPEGSKIVLLKMDDSYNQQPPRGTIGTVKKVDDAGTILPSWDGHGSLGVVYGEDIAKKLTIVPDDKNNPFYTDKADPKYTEILDLAVMLIKKGIPFEMKQCCDGWQIGYPEVPKSGVKTDSQIVVTQHQYMKGYEKNLLMVFDRTCDGESALYKFRNGLKSKFTESQVTADRALTIINEYLKSSDKKKYALTICQGEPEEKVVYAHLSQTEVDNITSDMAGTLNRNMLIKLDNGKMLEAGIVDCIELVKESEDK